MTFTAVFQGYHVKPTPADVARATTRTVVIASLLVRNMDLEEDLCDQLFNHSEKRLARALLKLEQGAKQIPMHVDPAQATKYIVNPLTGRKVSFAKLFSTHPPMEERIARLRAPLAAR